jgi:hypothetical protein
MGPPFVDPSTFKRTAMAYNPTPITVAELISFLQTQPQELQVGYLCRSELVLLELHQIEVVTCCEPRHDGWIQDQRPDKPTRPYLMFPGH